MEINNIKTIYHKVFQLDGSMEILKNIEMNKLYFDRVSFGNVTKYIHETPP